MHSLSDSGIQQCSMQEDNVPEKLQTAQSISFIERDGRWWPYAVLERFRLDFRWCLFSQSVEALAHSAQRGGGVGGVQECGNVALRDVPVGMVGGLGLDFGSLWLFPALMILWFIPIPARGEATRAEVWYEGTVGHWVTAAAQGARRGLTAQHFTLLQVGVTMRSIWSQALISVQFLPYCMDVKMHLICCRVKTLIVSASIWRLT